MELITDRALHVITRPSCNQKTALQPVITAEICNSALQDGPVITSNRAVVIGSLLMSARRGSEESISVTSIDRDYVSYLYTPATEIEGQRSVDASGCLVVAL